MNNVCVNEVTLVHHGTVKESVDWPSAEHASGHMYGNQVAWRDETTQFWELESHGSTVQIKYKAALRSVYLFGKRYWDTP